MGRAEDLFKQLVCGGESTIDDFILAQKSEELFLDFKRSANGGNGTVLDDNDRNNLGKAISGFGNSEGGIIIWGVDCSKKKDGSDVAELKVPITNIKRFASFIEGAVSGCTLPPHIGVRSHVISDRSGNGFLVTYVPKCEFAPLQSISNKHYYIRAGSDFVPTPHDVLAGMFGRRPQPKVFSKIVRQVPEINGDVISASIGLMIRNGGAVTARDLFMTVWIMSDFGENCRTDIETPDLTHWDGHWSFGRHISLMGKPDLRIPPDSHIQPIIINMQIAPPFTDDLDIDITTGCDGAPAFKTGIKNSSDRIDKAYKQLMVASKNGTLTEDGLKKFGEELTLRKGE